ncbi:SDR family NAD(P)-dependent oxidoreductase [Ramlibacter albus]|uniref:SDR family oxidoreductase n=1 Tax=Ramlibacter albus TaxID=2079448 RepID=A0A923M353_9BURK|nr:SDR family NAD(P)-dependent oxidoreductase [Ramlibacter albus]MBC5763006.1 SDR family oxidoreductase [Ramlibacter albus]
MQSPAAARFQGNVVVVTGAGQGIGRAAAERFAREGARVYLVDRAGAQGRAAAEAIHASGGDARFVQADLESYGAARDMVDTVLREAGRIDVAVHNVGGTIHVKPFWEYEPVQIEQEISRSLMPTLWCCREVIPVMLRQQRGAIVNVGSAVTRGGLFRVPYAAAKAGVHVMTACLAQELADTGVRINCVAPGAMDNADRVIPRNPSPPTDVDRERMQAMYVRALADTPLRRRGRADEAAAAICFLAADESSFITGQVLSVAGGATAS